MTFDSKMLEHLAKLSALHIATEEADNLQRDLNRILEYVARVSKHEPPYLMDTPPGLSRRKDVAYLTNTTPLFKVAPAIKDQLFTTPPVAIRVVQKPTLPNTSS